MKNLIVLGSALLLASAALADAAGYVVSDVTAFSRLPWENTVDLSFTVTPPEDAAAEIVVVDVVASNGVDEVFISDTTLTTRLVKSRGRQHLVWRAGAEHGGAYGNLKFYVSVKEAFVGRPPYMLVRMQDGEILYADHSITNILKKDMFFKDYMAFRYVPPTTSDEWKVLSGGDEYFRLGAPREDAGYNYKLDSDILKEAPRRVKLTQGFYLGVYPLTWGQLQCLGWPRSKIGPGDTMNRVYSTVVTGISYEEARGADTVDGYNFPNTTDVAPDSLVGVMRAHTGLAFDLPTDAQWEYAARAGSTNAYLFTATDIRPWPLDNFGEADPHMKPCNRWGFYGMVGCCHQWTTTLGRTSDNPNLNAADNNNFYLPENINGDPAVDPKGPATTYDHGYRIARGSHFRAGGETSTQDGKTGDIRYRVYRTAYKYAMKADKPAEEALCGVRLCLTVDP